MSDPVICVDRLSKKYRLRHAQQEPYKSLRDVLMNGARSLGRCLTHPKKRSPNPNHEDFWALQDVSFEVKQGDRVGIIGRNGAGKSTLLKILSRIVEPTAGRIRIRGRVASLLEVGTGFHPELTGRENIYLNGAILGMGRAEIKRKFDEIVAFAEVERFLDTPVKRYSSGMYVRLAFAVAAHLEPEILVVDEVLAVGDAQFQKKCLGKMQDVSQAGRTVLFVSHNMAAITKLCTSGIFLEHGKIRQLGDVHSIAVDYQRSISEATSQDQEKDFYVFSSQNQIGIANLATEIIPTHNAKSFTLRIQFDVISDISHSNIGVGFSLSTLNGVCVTKIAPSVTNYIIERLDRSETCIFECPQVEKYLAGGTYVLNLWLSQPKVSFLLKADDVATIEIPCSDVFGTGTYFEMDKHGIVPMPFTYQPENLIDFTPKRFQVS